MVLTGLLDENEGDQGSHFHRIDGNRFVLIRDFPRPRDGRPAALGRRDTLRPGGPAQN